LAIIGLSIFAHNFYNKVNMPQKIKATISQDKNNLANINQPRATIFADTIFINNISFRKASSLRHSTLGALNFKEDFFIDFDAEFEVMESKIYAFIIFSDDGFMLSIDGKTVAEYPGLKPFEEGRGYAQFNKGKHRLKLSYFQGRWDTGIVAYYTCENQNNKYKKSKFLIGDNSPCIKFIRQQ
jgi:hypothetical protein